MYSFKKVRKNIYITIITCASCLICIFALFSTSTYAWFVNSDTYNAGLVSTGTFSANLSFSYYSPSPNLLSNPNNDTPLLLKTAPRPLLNVANDNGLENEDIVYENEDVDILDDNETNNEENVLDTVEDIHVISFGEEQSGIYKVDICSTGDITGYLKVSIRSQSKEIKKTVFLKYKETKSFYVCTNEPITVEISQLTWSDYIESDSLDETLYFGSYFISFDQNLKSITPKYKKLSFIKSDGSQYISDIVIGSSSCLLFDKFENLETGEISYSEIEINNDIVCMDGDKVVMRLVPCENNMGEIGLYDTINDLFYKSETDSEFIAGEYVEDNGEILGLSFGGDMEQMEMMYGFDKYNYLPACQFSLTNYHFVGWKYHNTILSTFDLLKDLESLANPRNGSEIVLKAAWEMNQNYIEYGKKIETINYDSDMSFIQDIVNDNTREFIGFANSKGDIVVNKDEALSIDYWKKVNAENDGLHFIATYNDDTVIADKDDNKQEDLLTEETDTLFKDSSKDNQTDLGDEHVNTKS